MLYLLGTLLIVGWLMAGLVFYRQIAAHPFSTFAVHGAIATAAFLLTLALGIDAALSGCWEWAQVLLSDAPSASEPGAQTLMMVPLLTIGFTALDAVRRQWRLRRILLAVGRDLADGEIRTLASDETRDALSAHERLALAEFRAGCTAGQTRVLDAARSTASAVRLDLARERGALVLRAWSSDVTGLRCEPLWSVA